MCLTISMSSQLTNYLTRSRLISKHGEEDHSELHCFGKRKAKNNIRTRKQHHGFSSTRECYVH